MSQQVISITRALTRIKTIKNQLEDLSHGLYVLVANKHRLEVEKNPAATDGIDKTRQDYQRYWSLYNEYVSIKQAIQKSNFENKVIFNGKEKSIAELLFERELLEGRLVLFNNIEKQNAKVISEVEQQKNLLESEIEKSSARITVELKDSEQEFITQAIANDTEMKKRRYELVRCCGFDVDNYLVNERKSLDKFKEELDYILSEYNATTMITVEVNE